MGLTNMATNYTTKAAAEAATKAGATTGTKVGLNTLGKVTAGLGAAYGLYDIGSNLYSMNTDYRTTSDMMDASSKITQSAEGVNYDAYGGINTAAEMRYVNAQQDATRTNLMLGGAGTGMSIGSFFGPVGMALGTIGGGILGGILSLFDDRDEEVEREMEKLGRTFQGYNAQSESEAASQGLRNKFNLAHGQADKGKDAGGSIKKFNNGKTDYATVWTPAGQQFGKVGSLVGKGESLIDYTTGQAAYVDQGTKRVDNQPSIAQDGDQIVIAGNKIDPTNGLSYAEQAAPITKNIEKLNKIIDGSDQSTITGRLQAQQAGLAKEIAFRDMKQITDRQRLHNMYDDMMSKYNCGKNAKYDGGKVDWMSLAANGLSMLAPLSQYFHYKGWKPAAENPYVGNANARQALGVLGSLRDDPYNRIQAIKGANRQNIYAINQSGAYSPGQRMAMLTANNTNYAKNLAAEYAKSEEINRNLATNYANMLYNAGEADRKYAYDALNTQQQRRREAYAAQRLGIETAQKGMVNILGTTMQDLWKSRQFQQAQDYNNALIGLYGNQQKIDAARVYNDMNQARSNTNISQPQYRAPGMYLSPNGQTAYWDGTKWIYNRTNVA